MDEYSKQLLESYGINHTPDFSKLVEITTESFTYIPKDNSWDESHMLERKKNGLDFATVCVKTLNVDSRTAYELGLVKVVGWQVVDTFFSYIQPVYPLSKALRKILPVELSKKIDQAPSLDSIWSTIEHFFESNVLYGSEASTRRLIYCLEAYNLDISPVALPRGNGPQPEPANIRLKNGYPLERKTALEYAVQWTALRLAERYF